MTTQQINKKIAEINTIFKIDCYDGIAKAEKLFKNFEKNEIMSKPFGRYIIRIVIFKKGRTAIFLNFSEGIENEIKKTTSEKEYMKYFYITAGY